MSPGLASTFFKHSDLRSTHSKKLNSSSASPPYGTSPLEPTSKSCQAWNYKDSCSCDSPASNCASHHLCGVCKSSEHPMLHCPKRKMPIPNQQWLDSQNISLTVSQTRTLKRNTIEYWNLNFSQLILRPRLSLIFRPQVSASECLRSQNTRFFTTEHFWLGTLFDADRDVVELL